MRENKPLDRLSACTAKSCQNHLGSLYSAERLQCFGKGYAEANRIVEGRCGEIFSKSPRCTEEDRDEIVGGEDTELGERTGGVFSGFRGFGGSAGSAGFGGFSECFREALACIVSIRAITMVFGRLPTRGARGAAGIVRMGR